MVILAHLMSSAQPLICCTGREEGCKQRSRERENNKWELLCLCHNSASVSGEHSGHWAMRSSRLSTSCLAGLENGHCGFIRTKSRWGDMGRHKVKYCASQIGAVFYTRWSQAHLQSLDVLKNNVTAVEYRRTTGTDLGLPQPLLVS